MQEDSTKNVDTAYGDALNVKISWKFVTKFCWCGENFPAQISFEKFNVFHVRALYYTKTLITNKCTKRVISSIVTHSYMFRPWWVIFRENFFVIVTLRLHFIVQWECAVDCVLQCFWRRELSAVRTPESSRLQYTVHSRCVGLTILSPSCAGCLESGESQPPGSLQVLYRDCFTW
jgi:hypothetical protein